MQTISAYTKSVYKNPQQKYSSCDNMVLREKYQYRQSKNKITNKANKAGNFSNYIEAVFGAS